MSTLLHFFCKPGTAGLFLNAIDDQGRSSSTSFPVDIIDPPATRSVRLAQGAAPSASVVILGCNGCPPNIPKSIPVGANKVTTADIANQRLDLLTFVFASTSDATAFVDNVYSLSAYTTNCAAYVMVE